MKVDSFTPIIKPISLHCNLACSYCYYGPPRKEQFRVLLGDAVDKRPRMDTETLRALIREFGEQTPRPSFIWHGGEALLAGLGFYESVVNLQRELLPGETVNIVQSNGTMVTDEWARFFAQHQFRIGVSLDGEPDLHDAYRTHAQGNGSAQKAIEGIRRLQENGVNPSIICTVTKANAGFGHQTYRFLRSLGITNMKFGHLHERERFGNLSGLAATPEEYATFLLDVFEAWVAEDDPGIEVAELKSIIQILTGGSEKECIFAGVCDRYLTVEHNGSISWCDTIGSPHEVQTFGNIKNGLTSIVQSQQFLSFQGKLSQLHEAMVGQPWYRYLSFGCIGDYATLPFDNEHQENSYADGWVRVFNGISERLKRHGFVLAVGPD